MCIPRKVLLAFIIICMTVASMGLPGITAYPVKAETSGTATGAEEMLYDNFEDGDDLTPLWTKAAGAFIVDNDLSRPAGEQKVYRHASNTDTGIAVSGDASWTDYTYECMVNIKSVGTGTALASILARYRDVNNFYTFKLNQTANKVELHKIVNGSWSFLDEAEFTVNTNQWYKLKIELKGTSIKCYVDGTLYIDTTDGSLSSGKVGMRTLMAETNFDDVLVRSIDLTPTPAPAPTSAPTAWTTVTDNLDNWSMTYSHTANWRFDGSNAVNCDGDTSRATRTTTEPGNIVYNYASIADFSAMVYYHGSMDVGSSVKVYTSPDNITWTPLAVRNDTPVATNGGWSGTNFIPSAGIPSGTDYLKVEFTDPSYAWATQLSSVSITYAPAVSDNLDDWSKSYSHSANWRFDTGNTAYVGGDTSRAVRTTTEPGNIVYNYSSVTYFSAKVYYHGSMDVGRCINAYTSPDNIAFTPLAVRNGTPTATGGSWFGTDITPSAEIPSGTNYLKIEFTDTSAAWATQLSRITITYGGPQPMPTPAPTSTPTPTPPPDSSWVTVTDNLNFWDGKYIYARSMHWTFDTSNKYDFDKDTSRAARTSNTPEYLIYRFTSAAYFTAKVYTKDAAHVSGNVEVYTSPDASDASWLKLEIRNDTPAATRDGWYVTNFTPLAFESIPLGTNYVKIVLKDDASISSPQLSSIVFTYLSSSSFVSNIDWMEQRQVMEGFGAAIADYGSDIYNLPEPRRTELMHFLFDKNTGMGLNILRFRIWDDGNSGDACPSIHPDADTWRYTDANGEPLDKYQVWIAQTAKAINPDLKVIAVPWSPPGWMKTNGSFKNGGHLRIDMYQEFATMLANYCINYKKLFGVDIYAVSIQNEPTLQATYGSCDYTGDEMKNFLDILKATFVQKDVTTKIMASDSQTYNDLDANYFVDGHQSDPVMDLIKDTSGNSGLDIVSAHGYGVYGYYDARIHNPLLQAQKPFWMTEICHTDPNFTDTIEETMPWARTLHNYIEHAQASAWLYWRFVRNISPGEVLVKTDGSNPFTPLKLVYMMGNYSKFVQPGYIRIKADSSQDALITAYKDRISGRFVIVAVNDNPGADKNVTFNLNDFTTGSVTPYRTSGTEDLAKLPDIPVSWNSFTAVLPPNSITTFVGTASYTGETNPDIILSAYKPTYASSNERWTTSNYGIDPSVCLATDDYDGTSWVSAPDDTEWAYVDLLSSRDIHRIKVTWGANAAANYEIQVSDDKAVWTTVKTVTEGNTDLTGLALKARYVRVLATQRNNTAEGYTLAGLQVYGPYRPESVPVFVLSANGGAVEDGMSFAELQPVTFSVHANDTFLPIVDIKVSLDGKLITAGDPVSFIGQPGEHGVSVTATDACGNSTEETYQFNVVTSIDSIKQLLEIYQSSSELKGPLVPQLENSLDQAQQQLDINRPDQAAKHMEDFIKHLDNSALSDNISQTAAGVLEADAVWLAQGWMK